MPEEEFPPKTRAFRKPKRLLQVVTILLVLVLIIIYIIAWAPWVTDSFARERALSLLDPSCRELKTGEYEPPIINPIYKSPTLKERLGLEPPFGGNTNLYVLCDGKGLRNTYLVSFYGAVKLESSENVRLKDESKKDETADWKTQQVTKYAFLFKYPKNWFSSLECEGLLSEQIYTIPEKESCKNLKAETFSSENHPDILEIQISNNKFDPKTEVRGSSGDGTVGATKGEFITVGNKEAVKLVPTGPQYAYAKVSVVFNHNDKGFRIIIPFDPTSNSYDPIYDQILSTFRFE